MRRTVGVILILGSLTACQSEPKDPYEEWFASQTYRDFVPPQAQGVAKGAGVLTYTASQPGRVYVVDTEDLVDIKSFKKPRVIAASRIDQDASVRFDPIRREFQISGQNVMRMTKVKPGHEHEMRFIAIAERE